MKGKGSATMPRGLTINDKFPNLIGSTQNSDNFNLYEYLGDSWGFIFMHPSDFTPVCTTEVGEAAKREDEFRQRGVKICGFTCNDAASHRAWIEDVRQVTGGTVEFPIFCDPDRTHAVNLGILDEGSKNDQEMPLPVRSTFILAPDKTIKLTMTYPASTGRNFHEIFRTIDSLQLTVNMGVATPVNWKSGDDVIINDPLTDAEADQVFGKGGYRIEEVPSEKGKELSRHYMRWTKDPSMYPPEGS